MNANRRSRLVKIVSRLHVELQEIQSLAQEEQDAFDNMPESLQGGESGQKIEDAANSLQQMADDLENLISDSESIDA